MCSDAARNEQVEASVCNINFGCSSANVSLFRYRIILLLWKFFFMFAGHLHFEKSLQLCFMADFNIDYLF